MTHKELAKVHAKNKAQLLKALKQIKLSLNRSIKENNALQEYVNVRLYFMVYVAWLEATLSFILYDYNVSIKTPNVAIIENESNQEAKWKKLIELTFRRHYLNGATSKDLTSTTLGHTNFHRYKSMNKLLNEDILTYIKIRNKLAHGQWAIALNNEGSAKQQDTTSTIWKLKKRETLTLAKIIDTFVKLVEYSVASKNKFETNFDKLIFKVESYKERNKDSFQSIIETMRTRYDKYERTHTKK